MTNTPKTDAIKINGRVAIAAAAIVDVWMGGKMWRHRLDNSGFLESADWLMAVRPATVALNVADEVTR